MNDAPELTAELRLGRRALDGLPGVELLSSITWKSEQKRWVIPIRLHADTAESSIPPWTEWYVLLGEHYPNGPIDILPSKQGSIQETYPHQSLNLPGSATLPWRQGRLCLQTDLAALGLRAREEEPLHAATRLVWHLERAQKWLEAAARGQLVKAGDPFELPDLPISGDMQVVFREGPETIATWAGIHESLGWAELEPVPGNARVLAIRAFYSLDGRCLFSLDWGDLLRRGSRKRRLRVPWMRCPALPVLPPYAPPTCFPELEEAARAQERNLRDDLHLFASRLRDGKRHLCLVGFPIPEKAGGTDVRMHWWALRLPCFANRDVALRGYRRNEQSYWRYDQVHLFERALPIDWMRTDNWAPDELRSRGALPKEFQRSWVLLLGAGALGSAMAELLVRGGVSRLVIMDGEALEAGNLVRHTLDLRSVRYSKAYALAERLRAINPDLQVHAFSESLTGRASRHSWLMSRCDTLIDCTASDEVIDALGRLSWEGPRLFFSASFGVGARRLLCFSATGVCFPSAEFWQQSKEWLLREHEELQRTMFPREGIGCWHPVFPARADDVGLASAIAVKALVQAAATRPGWRLDVYEREEHDGSFQGVRRVPPVEARTGA